MSLHRIRAVLAVLAVGVGAVYVVRRLSHMERSLTAERAGHRLVDHVVHDDQQVVVAGLERRLSNLAAAVGVPAEPVPPVPPVPAASSNPKEGGH